MWKRILLVLFILFCVELGLLVIVLPWSELWERNALLALFPELRPALLNYYVRGAVSGLGVVNVWVGLADAWNFRRNLERMGAAGEAPPSAPVATEAAAAQEPRSNRSQ